MPSSDLFLLIPVCVECFSLFRTPRGLMTRDYAVFDRQKTVQVSAGSGLEGLPQYIEQVLTSTRLALALPDHNFCAEARQLNISRVGQVFSFQMT